MTETQNKLPPCEHVTRALAGEVICNIGQIGDFSRNVLNRAVKAGQLVKWRGYWFPVAGAAWGIGPAKTCWGTPETRARLASLSEVMTRDGVISAPSA